MSKTKTTKALYYSAWPTAWGPMGAVAGSGGVQRIILPHYEMKDLLALLAWEHQSASRDDEHFALLAQCCQEYFDGGRADFSQVQIDLPGEGTFFGKVYRAAMGIPYGRTVSYKALATQIGQLDAARAVATAMSKNPTPLIVPCHRVIYSSGEAGGFNAEGGEDLKRRLIDLEARHA